GLGARHRGGVPGPRLHRPGLAVLGSARPGRPGGADEDRGPGASGPGGGGGHGPPDPRRRRGHAGGGRHGRLGAAGRRGGGGDGRAVPVPGRPARRARPPAEAGRDDGAGRHLPGRPGRRGVVDAGGAGRLLAAGGRVQPPDGPPGRRPPPGRLAPGRGAGAPLRHLSHSRSPTGAYLPVYSWPESFWMSVMTASVMARRARCPFGPSAWAPKSTGGPIRIVIVLNGQIILEPTGWARSVPVNPMGMTGAPVRAASMATPV